MRIFPAIAAASFISAAASAADFAQCKHDGTQLEMTACAADDLKTADDELNRAYRALLEKEKDNKPFVDKLRAAQKAWVEFRDAELDAMYSCKDADPRACWGSMLAMCEADYRAKLTKDRTKRLSQLLHAGPPADDCN